MPTADQVLNLARDELGYLEPGWGDDDAGDQLTKFGQWFAQQTGMGAYRDTYWCQMFVTNRLHAAGFGREQVGMYGNCNPAIAMWKAHGRWSDEPSKGAVVYFSWNGDKVAEHVGFVEAVLADGRIQTIEGNASDPAGKGRDGVYRRKRARSLIVGYGRPPYGSATPAPQQKDDDMTEPELIAALTSPPGQHEQLKAAIKRLPVYPTLGPIDPRTKKGTGVRMDVAAATGWDHAHSDKDTALGNDGTPTSAVPTADDVADAVLRRAAAAINGV